MIMLRVEASIHLISIMVQDCVYNYLTSLCYTHNDNPRKHVAGLAIHDKDLKLDDAIATI